MHIPEKNKELFEKNINIINNEINKRQVKWNLTAIPSISFEDIAQNLRFHIYIKIHLYNPKKSKIENWLNTIITNQLKNMWRSLYVNYNKPCISCACAEGDDGCRIYGTQDNSCPLVDHWQKFKISAYNTKLPLSIENHQQEIFDLPNKGMDLEMTISNFHAQIKTVLNENEYQVYQLAYIQHKSDEEVIKSLNKDSEKTLDISKIRRDILTKAKKLLKNNEVDFVEN